MMNHSSWQWLTKAITTVAPIFSLLQLIQCASQEGKRKLPDVPEVEGTVPNHGSQTQPWFCICYTRVEQFEAYSLGRKESSGISPLNTVVLMGNC